MVKTGPTTAERRRQTVLARRLAEAGFVLPGSLITRNMRCGKDNCRCHGEPPELHGPYQQWSRTTGGKTLTRLWPDDLAERYRGWFDNARRLRETITELEALSVVIAERDRASRR